MGEQVPAWVAVVVASRNSHGDAFRCCEFSGTDDSWPPAADHDCLQSNPDRRRGDKATTSLGSATFCRLQNELILLLLLSLQQLAQLDVALDDGAGGGESRSSLTPKEVTERLDRYIVGQVRQLALLEGHSNAAVTF
jgi:hypothetical protein